MINQHNYIFLGPPGSGKGTQAKILSETLKLPHIDTGSLLRKAIADNTDDGKIAKSFMDNGQLVPLKIVMSIIKNQLIQPECKNGFILDGYPRNLEQAEGLNQILNEININLRIAFYIDLNQNVLIERIVNRQTCKNCGTVYNTKFNRPKINGKCDKCSSDLYQRSDDNLESTKKRFVTYNNETKPLIDFYNSKGILVNINGNNSLEEIQKEIYNLIKW